MVLQAGGCLWERGGWLSSHLAWLKAWGHVCRCPVACCDMFILFLSCVNCCSLMLQSSGKVLELTGYER